jgi:predicted transcriptional regulator
MQEHSETEENYSLKNHGKKVAAKVIPLEDILRVIKSWYTNATLSN